MAPKKEKGGTASNSSKIWEPSLVAAPFNQVSPGPVSAPCPGPPGPAQARPDLQTRPLPAAHAALGAAVPGAGVPAPGERFAQ